MQLHGWNERAVELVRQNFKKRKNGATCLFVPLSSRSGVKLYYHQGTRDACFRKQQRAAKLGFGPRADHPFEIDDADLLEFFRKKTKRAKFAFGWSKVYKGYDPITYRSIFEEVKWTKVYGYITQVVKPCVIRRWEYYELLAKVLKSGMNDCDIGEDHNVGRLNGKPVLYDFDHA